MKLSDAASLDTSLSNSFLRIAILVAIAIAGNCHAGAPSTISAIGVGIKFNQNEWKLYTEVSYWFNIMVGLDAGIEMGNKSMDIYTDGQLGFVGLSGYSHGAYYRNPYSAKNYFGFRGKAWSGAFVYMAFDLDYTDDVHMFGVFVKKPYEYENGEWKPLSLAW